MKLIWPGLCDTQRAKKDLVLSSQERVLYGGGEDRFSDQTSRWKLLAVVSVWTPILCVLQQVLD